MESGMPENKGGESETNIQKARAEQDARLCRLREALALCPSDIVTRCDLATLLEESNHTEEAWLNWKAVLDCDPNHLKAREGVARCHPQIRSLRRFPRPNESA